MFSVATIVYHVACLGNIRVAMDRRRACRRLRQQRLQPSRVSNGRLLEYIGIVASVGHIQCLPEAVLSWFFLPSVEAYNRFPFIPLIAADYVC